MIPVASLDAAMLVAETAEMPLHNAGVLVFDPPPAPDADRFEAMRRMVGSRLDRAPALRRKLVGDRFGISDLRWIDDPRFDVDRHLSRVRLPSPAGPAELATFVGTYAAVRLERDKPLWEIVLVEGLASGEVVAVAKLHHAAMDGLHLARLVSDLFDRSPDAVCDVPSASAWRPEPEPGPVRFALESARLLAQKPRKVWCAARDIAHTLARRNALQGRAQRPRDGARMRVPRTPWSGALGVQRAVALADVRLSDVLEIRSAFHVTVNDVVLAAAAETLRAWLLARDSVPTRSLVANVPITVGREGEGDPGNTVSMLRVALPVEHIDAVERLRRIGESTRHEKHTHRARGANTYLRLADLVMGATFPSMLTGMMALYSRHRGGDLHPAPWNVVISNVPGPRDALYCAGARLTRIYPFGPVQHGSGLNLTVMTTGEHLCLGALACPEKVPDLDEIARGFERAIEALLARARTAPRA